MENSLLKKGIIGTRRFVNDTCIYRYAEAILFKQNDSKLEGECELTKGENKSGISKEIVNYLKVSGNDKLIVY